MSLQLHCKRSKMFIRHAGDSNKKTEKVLCPRGATTNVPDWVKDTEGYRLGLVDQSIIDLTPPKPVAVAAAEPASEPAAEAEADGQETAKKPAAPKKSPVPKGMQGASTVVETR